MQRIRSRSFAVLTVTATLVVGLTGMGTAHADGMMTVTPSTGLSNGHSVTIELSAFTPDPLATAQFALCGNAYANNTPLTSMPPVVFGQLNARSCEVIRFTSPGDITTDPFSIAGAIVPQTGIGTGNRSCIPSPPAVADCFVYISTSVNLPTFPTVPVTFAEALPPGGAPAPTSTTVSATGSPINDGKAAHAVVTVTSPDPTLRPEGDVEVFEGTTSLGTATLDDDGQANVAIGTVPLGSHALTADFLGNGSFDPSSSSASTLEVIDPKNVSIGDVEILEGDDTGRRLAVFTVVLPEPSAVPVTVEYTVVGSGANPATLDEDFLTDSGKVKFKAGKNPAKYVKVKIVGDTEVEGDETFEVHLATPDAGYILRDGVGHGTIVDDDSPTATVPTVGITDVTIPEGDVGGKRALKFNVTLTTAQLTDVIVAVEVSNLTATRGKKKDPEADYAGRVTKNIRLRPGKVTKFMSVPAFADTRNEIDETLRVKILSATGGAVVGPHDTAIGTILSDE